ncbi:MAG TPA: nucleotidyl transferase AbiEii/AbiGii toxin family protein [Anaerolineales bacterium]|nr:nucleotidyl transferase AbiEii/AbiGii toxin family protein [Anaerolineales bacterium]
MRESQKNIAASIQARLKREAEEQGKPYAELLQYYGMERFLYRLSRSQYVDKFVLKGGSLIYGWNILLRRPTRDIDFRGYLENSAKAILLAMRDVIKEPVPDDGMVFDAKTIHVEQTQIDADYEGTRVKFTGYLGKARIPMQIDIGFSDVLTSRVERLDYPTLLDDAAAPRLKSYPKESMVSEKFHAMIRHAQLNSRFKDYYDLWLIADNLEFDGQPLQRAIKKTFAKRNTAIPVERPAGLTVEFARTNRDRWARFLNKSNLQSKAVADFVDIVERIWTFIEYPIRISFEEEPSNKLYWIPQKGWN